MSCLTLGGGAHIPHASLRVLHFKKENQGPSGLSATDLSESMPKMTSLVARLGHLEPSVLGLDVYDARTEGAAVHVQEPARGAEGTSLSPLERTTKCGAGGGNWVGSWVG